MRQAYTFLILGIWLAILPFLGLPYSWKNLFTTFTGLTIIYLSYMSYRQYKTKEIKKTKTFENFSENNFNEEDK